jgi:hypothetical protein
VESYGPCEDEGEDWAVVIEDPVFLLLSREQRDMVEVLIEWRMSRLRCRRLG